MDPAFALNRLDRITEVSGPVAAASDSTSFRLAKRTAGASGSQRARLAG